jgi:hypothetical protein
MSRGRALLVALALASGAFVLGVATAPTAAPDGATSVEGPQRLELPALSRVAPLPQPREAPVAATEAAPEEGEAAPLEAVPETEAPAPVEAAPESPAPEESSPPPSGGGEEVVPEGL